MSKKLLPLIATIFFGIFAQAQVHTSYLWHMHQPIYWPDRSVWDPYRYQTAWESHWRKFNAGENNPLNDLEEIFSKDDRRAVYQYRVKDAIQTLTGYSEAGAQVNYSGSLIKNVNSLAAANQWGYYPGWQNDYVTARNWTTSGGKPRLDITAFTFHHVLSPLVSEQVLRKEIQAHRYIYQQTFGTTPEYSKGFWPAECSFSQRNIKVLVEEGIEWTVIANSRLARTLADYPLQFGTSGCNIDPPNRADKVATTGNNWWSGQIDGRGGTFSAPYCYQAHKAKYVDPESGSSYLITVVPMCDLLSYQNGYGTMGVGEIASNIAPYSPPNKPCIVLMAHDGDNAWGGGYDYYMNSVPGFAGAAHAAGYVPTTIEQFLADHPVADTDVVHVEDGSWVNAENDWGHPQFINWLWPMFTSNFMFDPNGWTEDARNWAVITAAENHVIMAEDLAGVANISKVVYPEASSSNAEKAWHHLLPGIASCFMYYGVALDMEVKASLAANIAVEYADAEIALHPGVDNTPPSVFIPQRYPYNPGGIGFGPTYGYQQHQNSSDFTVWTLAYDVNGIQSAKLMYRVDFDGLNPLTDDDNDTYAGGPGVGNWQSIDMTARIFPAGNITGNPEIDFFIMPTYIATQYHADITGLHDTLVDYYVEVTDNYGNVTKTPIQHVYIGASNAGGNQDGVFWTPNYPNLNDTITVTITNASIAADLHWGVRSSGQNWQTPIASYQPTGSQLFNGTGPAIESAFSGPDADNILQIQIGPFNDSLQVVEAVNFVIHWSNNTWDNNNGSDYYIPINNTAVKLPSYLKGHEKLSVFPNPAVDKLFYRMAENNLFRNDINVQIIDNFGRIVENYTNMPVNGSIATSNLYPGIYILLIHDTSEGEYFLKRFSKIR